MAARLHIRMPNELVRRLDRCATAIGVSRGEWIRRAVRRYEATQPAPGVDTAAFRAVSTRRGSQQVPLPLALQPVIASAGVPWLLAVIAWALTEVERSLPTWQTIRDERGKVAAVETTTPDPRGS